MEETGSGARGLPSFVGERHAAAAAEVAEFDGLMERKLKQLPPSKLKDIAVVVGIPFYTEVSNIISVLHRTLSLACPLQYTIYTMIEFIIIIIIY